jgi:predicted RNA binding protein YcfA (HicA-like mRNA interferase family)
MPKLPQLTGADVVRRLTRLGFYKARQKGSHVIMKNDVTAKFAIVPCHGGKTIKKGTLHGILTSAGITVEQLLEA